MHPPAGPPPPPASRSPLFEPHAARAEKHRIQLPPHFLPKPVGMNILAHSDRTQSTTSTDTLFYAQNSTCILVLYMNMYSKHTQGTLSTGDKMPVAASSCAGSHCMLASALTLTNGMGRRSDDALVPAASETSRLR